MIHQFIFAGPKPGLKNEAFTSYWINFHAPDYAAKIPQIQQYLVAGRVDLECGCDLPFFQGVAEIWLKNEDEQIASMQSQEFLDGARRDEPRWAAFWQTLVLDTESEVLEELPSPQPWLNFIKLYTLLKRNSNLSVEQFRTQCVESSRKPSVDGLQRHLVAFSRLNQYGLGEPRFDAVEVRSFKNREALAAFVSEPYFIEAVCRPTHVDSRFAFNFVGQENWIIRAHTR